MGSRYGHTGSRGSKNQNPNKHVSHKYKHHIPNSGFSQKHIMKNNDNIPYSYFFIIMSIERFCITQTQASHTLHHRRPGNHTAAHRHDTPTHIFTWNSGQLRVSMSNHASTSRVYRGVRHARLRCASERYVHTGWFSLAELVHTKKAEKNVLTGGSPRPRGWCQHRLLTQILKISALVHVLYKSHYHFIKYCSYMQATTHDTCDNYWRRVKV